TSSGWMRRLIVCLNEFKSHIEPSTVSPRCWTFAYPGSLSISATRMRTCSSVFFWILGLTVKTIYSPLWGNRITRTSICPGLVCYRVCGDPRASQQRSEEHTSELQSRFDLV